MVSAPRARRWVAVALVGLPAPAPAQEPAGVFGDRIDVTVLNLEVVVTDRSGRRVEGLESGDFRLFVDAREVPVEYFSEIRDGVFALGPGGEDDRQPPGDQRPTGRAASTNYLLFVDELFALRHERDRGLRKVSSQIATLGPDDRMAVVAFTGEGLELLCDWTASPVALAAALAEAEERPTRGTDLASWRRFSDNVNAFAPGDCPRGGALDTGEAIAAERATEQVESAASAAALAMLALAPPAGRRALLLLSGGWPSDPSAYASAGGCFVEPDEATGARLLAPLLDAANLAGYTIYAVDLHWLDNVYADRYERERWGEIATLRAYNQQATLHTAADETGGLALLGRDRDHPLGLAIADTRSYYWLGLTLDREFDDRDHRVRVEVLRPGLSVRHRDGYRDLSRDAEARLATSAAFLLESREPR